MSTSAWSSSLRPTDVTWPAAVPPMRTTSPLTSWLESANTSRYWWASPRSRTHARTAAASSRAARASMRGARDVWRAAVEMGAMYTWSFSGATGNRRDPAFLGRVRRNFLHPSEFILQTLLFAAGARSQYGARRRRTNEESIHAQVPDPDRSARRTRAGGGRGRPDHRAGLVAHAVHCDG